MSQEKNGVLCSGEIILFIMALFGMARAISQPNNLFP